MNCDKKDMFKYIKTSYDRWVFKSESENGVRTIKTHIFQSKPKTYECFDKVRYEGRSTPSLKSWCITCHGDPKELDPWELYQICYPDMKLTYDTLKEFVIVSDKFVSKKDSSLMLGTISEDNKLKKKLSKILNKLDVLKNEIQSLMDEL